MERCVQCWSSQYKKETNILENIHRRVMNERLEHLSYMEGLKDGIVQSGEQKVQDECVNM